VLAHADERTTPWQATPSGATLALSVPDDSCRLTVGIGAKPDPFASIAQYRTRWNSMVRANQTGDQAFTQAEFTQITNVIKGVTVSLLGASSTPVTLNVTSDPSGVEQNLSDFVTQFNALTSQIGTYTAFNTNTNQGALLLGDPTTQQIQENIFNTLNATVEGNGQYNSFSSIGITIGENAQISFNQTQFEQAFASDPNAVQNLFSQTTTGLGNVIAKAVTNLTDPVSGLITLEQNTLATQIQNYQTYYNDLANVVAQKQSQLESQFANLEDTIAQLQSQQQVLGTITGASSAASSSASSPAASAASSEASSASSSSTGSTSSTSG